MPIRRREAEEAPGRVSQKPGLANDVARTDPVSLLDYFFSECEQHCRNRRPNVFEVSSPLPNHSDMNISYQRLTSSPSHARPLIPLLKLQAPGPLTK